MAKTQRAAYGLHGSSGDYGGHYIGTQRPATVTDSNGHPPVVASSCLGVRNDGPTNHQGKRSLL